jgi:hypothetical protein
LPVLDDSAHEGHRFSMLRREMALSRRPRTLTGRVFSPSI